MRLPQFSLKTLGGIVALAAIGCCSLVYASSTWSAAIYTAAIIFLAMATLAAIYSRQQARAYWVGCALCGWLYLLLIFGPLPATQQMASPGQLNVDSELVTTHLARWLYGAVLPKLRKPPSPVKLSFTGSLVGSAQVTGEIALNGLAGEGGDSAFTMVPVDAAQPIAAGTPFAKLTTAAKQPPYPDEMSFVRVSHALWTWLFALTGGMLGKWLHGRFKMANGGQPLS
jgi:hypothetical protein